MVGSFPECGAGTWSRSCPQGITKLTSSHGWRTGAGYPSSNIVKRHVHMIVWVGSGTAWVKYGRITVTYAVLK